MGTEKGKARRKTKEHRKEGSVRKAGRRPLFALVSQILVALTVELDNAFEKNMQEAGFVGAGLSWNVWARVMRFVGEGVSVKELGEKASAGEEVTFLVGCLERWRFLVLDEGSGKQAKQVLHKQSGKVLRDGWGSGRGIRDEWIVRLTEKGRKAVEIWPGLFREIEKRWSRRFGEAAMERLRGATVTILNGVGSKNARAEKEGDGELPAPTEELPLVILLGLVLMGFSREFRAESETPLGLCANTIRVLGEEPVRAGEIARLTGASKEMVAIGWKLKQFVTEERDLEAKRGMVVRLNAVGLVAKKEYEQVVEEIERRWAEQYGEELRTSLEGLFRPGLLAEGLAAPEGVARAGTAVPALGRRAVAPAAKQRVKDLVEQTKWFVSDPEGALPWFPLWDMNRGFGV